MFTKSSSKICTQCLRQTSAIVTSRRLSSISISRTAATRSPCANKRAIAIPGNIRAIQKRTYANKSTADEVIEEITELYGAAQDEFEIASEESEKHSVYAADDRKAAREELAKLLKRYNEVVGGSEGLEVAEEVKRRVGGRIRELENAVEVLNEKDFED